MIEISVVSPVFNEEKNIVKFTESVLAVLKLISNNYEIILVDDGSSDNTWLEIKKLSTLYKNVFGIKLSKNFGQHHAISCGLDKSNGNWVVVMDSDLQDDPDVIFDLYNKANQGHDIVVVNRLKRSDRKMYLLFQRVFYFLFNKLSGLNFNSRQANFSIINKKVVQSISKIAEQARFYPTALMWIGFDRAEIEAKQGMRFRGTPSYSIIKRIRLAIDVILNFSHRPLYIGIAFGFLFSTFSIVLIISVIYNYFSRGFAVLGWPSLIASIFLTAGVILIVLGIVGLYVGKIFQETKKRPLYIISDECGN